MRSALGISGLQAGEDVNLQVRGRSFGRPASCLAPRNQGGGARNMFLAPDPGGKMKTLPPTRLIRGALLVETIEDARAEIPVFRVDLSVRQILELDEDRANTPVSIHFHVNASTD